MDFWNRHYYHITEGYRVFTNMLPHSGLLLGIKPVLDIPHLAGSTFHISQGGEIRHWQWQPPVLTLGITLGRTAQGTVLIGTAGYVLVEAPEDAAVEQVADNVIGLTFTVRGQRTIQLTFSKP